MMTGINFAVAIVKETGSTNDDLEALVKSDVIQPDALSNFHGYTELAFSQTSGHGRFERVWDSGRGGLYQSTLLFMEKLPGVNFNMLTITTAVSVLSAIEKYAPGCRLSVKWPNDITAGGRKICGILMKAMPGRPGTPVIIGIGVNVFNRVDESKLRNSNILPPCSLSELTSESFGESDITALGGGILAELDRNLQKVSAGEYGAIFAEYNSKLLYKDEIITLYDRVEDGRATAEGRFIGLDENGFLLIEDADTKAVSSYPSGEIKKLPTLSK
jgi:BirA family biotin operon repressor/biotin-[acetyl-CoA-carboxylase] ligase